LKFAATSVLGWTLPEPDTVDWTTPRSAVTISRAVRAELAGAPISITAAASTPAPIRPSPTRCQDALGRLVILNRERPARDSRHSSDCNLRAAAKRLVRER
jgi:hypothetical protein